MTLQRQAEGSGDAYFPPASCGAAVPPDSRALLFTLCPPYHGSTALEGVLMSSSNLATLCSSRRWQCEGREIMMKHGRSGEPSEWDYEDMLAQYSEYWNLSRPVFLEKTPSQIFAVQREHDGVLRARLPPKLRNKHGVKHLDTIYVLMWRPVCLGVLSSHLEQEEKKELDYLQRLVDAHRYLTRIGVPVLVINYADLVWRPELTLRRLSSFLPCLGQLDIDFVPREGKDVFRGNKWKVSGSVREFGRRVDPERCCDYSVEQRRCTKPTFDNSTQPEVDTLTSYLLSVS